MSVIQELILPTFGLAAFFAAGTIAVIVIRRRLFGEAREDSLTTFIELRNSGAITAEEWERIKESASRQS